MQPDPRFIEGLRLFNEGQYFEAHEEIEDLWLETPSEDPHRDLYKGVIQAAASLYQLGRGILSGAVGLHLTSVRLLSRYQPSTFGLNVEKLIHDMDGVYAEVARGSKILLVVKLEYSEGVTK